MATLNVYDKFGELLETHHISRSLRTWMVLNVPSFYESVRPPYSATLNGKPWPYEDHSRFLSDDDVIDLTIEPNGDPITTTLIIVSLVVGAAAYYTASQVPDLNPTYNNPSEYGKGSTIYNASARANEAKPSQPIPDIAGKINIFPDLINPIRRKYINHKDYIYLMLCVGQGYYFLQDENIYIAETTITNYRNDIEVGIFEPGDLVTSSDAHENWFTSKEVAGLELTTSQGTVSGNWTMDASGTQMTSYLNGVATTFPFIVDETFEITSGSNQGFYKVSALSGGSNQTATVIEQVRGSDANAQIITGMQRAAQEAARFGNPIIAGRIQGEISSALSSLPLTDSGSTSLTSVTGETVTWKGIYSGLNWYGPFEVIPENETAQYYEFDVHFPRGLYQLSSGELSNYTVTIEVQYREVGTASWNTVSSTSYTSNSLDERGYTVSVNAGSKIRAEFRFRRVTKESQVTDIVDSVFIRALRGRLPTKTSYPGVTTIGLKIKGTNALAGTAENQINIKGATRKLPTLAQIQAKANSGTDYDLTAATTQSTGSSWDLSTAGFDHANNLLVDFSVGDSGIDFNSDGSKILVSSGSVIGVYNLSTAYDVRTATLANSIDIDNTTPSPPNAVRWSLDGTRLYLLKTSAGVLYEWTMSTAYDVSTATSTDSYTLPAPVSGGTTVAFSLSSNGNKLYFGNDDGNIYQFSLSTAYDISTASYDTKTFDASTELSADLLQDCFIADSGTKLYVMADSSIVYKYDLLTGYDISTASYDTGETLTAADVDPNSGSIYVTSDYLFMTESDNLSVRAYALSTVTDSAATRSPVRFLANAIYNVVGSEIVNLVDFSELSTLETTLDSRADYLDIEFKDETTLFEAMKIMLAPAYAEPVVKNGKLVPVRTVQFTGLDTDESRFDRLYTPDFMLDDGLRITHEFINNPEYDGVDVEYLNEDSGENQIVECRLTGDTGLRPKRITAPGITNRVRAWRYGMRERRRMAYKPATLTFTTELDALNSYYGDSIAIASEVLGSQYGTLTAYSEDATNGSTVTADFDPEFGSDTYYAAFKKPTGAYSGLYEIADGTSANQFVLVNPKVLNFTPEDESGAWAGEATTFTIGTADDFAIRGIIRNVAMSDDQATVTCEEYLDQIYVDDNATPPAEEDLDEAGDDYVSGTGDIVLEISSNDQNVNLRTLHDLYYSSVSETQTIVFQVKPSILVGSLTTSGYAIEVGTWPAYATLKLEIGAGAYVVAAGGDGPVNANGLPGGTAFYTRTAISIDNAGTIAAGGGGGGGATYTTKDARGGGGAGYTAGYGSGYTDSGGPDKPGQRGTLTTGGPKETLFTGVESGVGGNLGQAGSASTTGKTGGAAGVAVDGDSYITWINTGTITGSQIN